MAKSYCKYHPQTPSRLYCPTCAIHFCSQCIKPEFNGNSCPICREELESLGVGNTITPFWERFPRFFTYPARLDILIFLAVISILSLVIFVKVWLYLFLTFLVLKYAYVILNHTAEGHLSPPSISITDLGHDNYLPLKQVVVFVIMSFIVNWAFTLGTGIGVIVFLFLLFSIPASVMIMALDQSIVKALNPLTLMGIMSRVGRSYFVLYLLLLLLSGGGGIIEKLLAPVLPIGILFVVGSFAGSYFTLVMFNLMGYFIYQYHEELGFEGVREFEESLETGKTDPFLNEIKILLAEGMIDEAKKRLKNALIESNNLEYHQRYHELLFFSKDKEELPKHGEQYITALIASAQQNTINKAIEIYVNCLKFKSDFSLPNGDHTYLLADTAKRQRKYDLALRMVNKFAQRYPDNPDQFDEEHPRNPAIPKAYFLAAKIMYEQKHQEPQAQKILLSLLRQFPDHPLIPEIQKYLEFIKGKAVASN